MASSPSALASARARHGARAMGNKAGKPTRDDTGRASTSASDLAAKDANAAGAADAAAAASSSEPPTHEPVPGLRVVLDVLSEAQHDRVVAWLLDTLERGRAGALRGDTYAPIPDKWQKRNQSREMLQFGTYTHSNRVESFRDVEAMPEALSAVVECLRTAGVYGKQTVDDGVSNDETCETHALPTSCTVNFYEKGQWIPPHIDNPAFDRPVVTVSLRSTQRMTLGRGIEHDYAREHEHASSCRSGTDDFPASSSSERDGEKNDRLVVVALPRRGAVVLRGAAADEYEHAIPPVSSPRISLTFRALGDPNAAATKARIARADARRARYRAERARATSSAPRRGYGPVGPKGAVGRVGPLPEDVAAAEARRRAREGAVAAKREKKYRNTPSGGSGGGSEKDAAVPETPPKLSKARAKKEARKAARAAARTKRRTEAQTAQTDATSTDATNTDASIDASISERTEKDNPTTTTTTKPTFAISADGVTRVERRAKTRSCPPCPPELLPEATIEKSKSGDREGDGFGMTNDGVEAEAEAEAEKQKQKRSSNRKNPNVGVIPGVELENVQRVYDAVARQWHGTRYRAWSGVEDFVTKKCAARGALVADVGCGNGKNAPAVMRAGLERGGAQVIGCDFSMGLLEICANERDANDGGSEVFAADAARLPLRSRVFDAALNVAVLHHVSTASRRFALVAETMRVLRVGGVALFYAWALEQETGGVSGHRFESQDVLVPFHKRAEGTKKNKESESGNKNDKVSTEARVFQRYCHVYKEGELEALFDPLREWCRVDRVYYDCGNWCAEVTRTK